KIAKALSDGARKVPSLTDKIASGGVVNAAGALGQIRDVGSPPAPAPPYNNNPNQVTDGSNLPPELKNENDGRRAKGKDGKRDQAPAARSGAPVSHLPDLAKSRKTRKSPATSAPSAPIHANLICADCDPSGGGGAVSSQPSDPYFGTARSRRENE